MSDHDHDDVQLLDAPADRVMPQEPLAPEINLASAKTDSEWLARLDELGDELDPDAGGFTPLGQHHAALYSDGSDTLLVSFESIATIRERQPDHRPMGFTHARARGWSSLSVVARQPRWFRDTEICDYFDAQIDAGFFDGFRRVLFYGEGMCGYAACAYSLAAAGATVLAIAPQATLDPAIAGWDRRFMDARRLDFRSRFGFAPAMLDGGRNAFIVHDPARKLDLMHATLFRRPFVTLLRSPDLGRDTAVALARLGALAPMIDAAAEGKLTPLLFHRLMRARREDAPYLERLTRRCARLSRHPALTLAAAHHALARSDSRKLRKCQSKAEKQLSR
ncbi:phosphoadenosine phosphosulfate reductase [Roseinatronobacter alkalisoli]|uniref:Phosphoadenosine phosphosulfate reductase n=1 Tax=Roseinatronobacter alkalisoli TaxID=3028235 RepID=A0ABT5T7J6_9RHOB|nr:phosphoadenosine phosphosulfate reductase [Roseinatronobacter sp. HJB301]MDD7970351.1 phosphoadenosine phosphosulfate reductase [Roseinatronobacter sp. HJB301]